MHHPAIWLRISSLLILLFSISSCGTDGTIHTHVYDASDTQDPESIVYYVSASVSGLSGAGLVLELNDREQIQVAVDGTFSFIDSPLEMGSDYKLSIQTQPAIPSQFCAVTAGSGTIEDANPEAIEIVCTTNTFRVGGLLSGMSGEGLVLSLNDTWEVSPEENGDLTFQTAYLLDGTDYSVQVNQQPEGPNQTCVVENGQGSIGGSDVTSMVVRCVTNHYAVGGTVAGLQGSGLVLKMGTVELPITENGSFAFSEDLVEDGRLFEVTVLTQPVEPNQACTVESGGGMIAGSAYTDTLVTCVDDEVTETDDD